MPPGEGRTGQPERHIQNVAKFGVKAVVAINHFPTDTEEETPSCRALRRPRHGGRLAGASPKAARA